MRLTYGFIQSDLQCVQCVHFISMCDSWETLTFALLTQHFTNWATCFETEALSLFWADHRLHHAARHRLSVRQTEGVPAGGRREPARFHLSLRHVTSEAAHKHSPLCHWVRTCFQPLKHVNILHFFFRIHLRLTYVVNHFYIFSAYKQLNVKHEPLQLITPQFETPLPPLQPAVSLFPFSYITLCIHAKLYLLVTLLKAKICLNLFFQYSNTFSMSPVEKNDRNHL